MSTALIKKSEISLIFGKNGKKLPFCSDFFGKGEKTKIPRSAFLFDCKNPPNQNLCIAYNANKDAKQNYTAS